MKNAWAKQDGFTIVELLIVIVVIAILAAISIVAYNGIHQRASIATADSALNQAVKKLSIYEVENGNYPATLAEAGVSDGSGVTYDYSTNSGAYCISATTSNNTSRVIAGVGQKPASGDCSIALVKWTKSGSGVTYDAQNNQFTLSTSASGSVSSPLVANNGSATATISTEVYVTLPSPNATPNSRNYFGSNYYASDKTTPVQNTIGYTGNGDAHCIIPMSTWTTCTWKTWTGPNVAWVRFRIQSAPTTYTSDNIYRNVQITTGD